MHPELTETVEIVDPSVVATAFRGDLPVLRATEAPGRVVISRPDAGGWTSILEDPVPSAVTAIVAFGTDDAGALYVAEVRTSPLATGPSDGHLWRFDADILTPIGPVATDPGPRGTCPEASVVAGDPARLARGLEPPPLDGDAPGPQLGEIGPIRRVDRWRLDLSDAAELDQLVQVEYAVVPADSKDYTGTFDGFRASWVFLPLGPRRWCALGPLAAGWSGTELLGGPSWDAGYPILDPRPGLASGRTLLVVSRDETGVGNGGSGGDLNASLVRLEGASLVELPLTIDHVGHGINGDEYRSSRWAVLGDALLVAGSRSSTQHVTPTDDEDHEARSLQVFRLEGGAWTPWITALPERAPSNGG